MTRRAKDFIVIVAVIITITLALFAKAAVLHVIWKVVFISHYNLARIPFMMWYWIAIAAEFLQVRVVKVPDIDRLREGVYR